MPVLVQINATLNQGSTGTISENIALVAQERGWKCYIAHGARYVRPSKIEEIKFGSLFDNYIHFFISYLFGRHGFGSYFATKRLIKKLKCIKPDLIHLHNIHGYYLNYRLLFKYLSEADIPVVWTFHDCWAVTGHCTHYTVAGCYKWRTKCYSCPQLHLYYRSLFFDHSASNHRLKKAVFSSVKNLHIVTVSNWLGSVAKASFMKQFPIQTIYNGINIKTFVPTSSNVRKEMGLEGKFVMIALATSGFGKHKGLDDYIKLCSVLSNEYRLLLVGVDKDLIATLHAGILGMGRTDSIQRLVELYSMADVVMNLSYQETFGLTVAEGYSCGTPAIVYNDTALPELIVPETGFCIESGDINGVVEALKEIKRKGKKSYSQACIERAHTMYDKDKQYAKYVDLYNSVILSR